MKRLFALIVLMLTPSLCFAQASVHTLAGVNAQTGTSYTIVAVDQTKLLTFNNANPVAVTLPSAVTTNFGIGAIFAIRNLGAGAVTITPASGTIDGAGSLVLSQGQGADIYSDGSNYVSQKGAGGGGIVGGMTPNQVPIAATATSIASSKPLQGTDLSIMSSGFISGVAAPLCTDAPGGATTTGCPNISGATSGQVAIAGSPNTITSSKPIQGTETNLLSSDGGGSTGLPYCRSASGGATTAGCPSGGGSPGGAPVQAQFNNAGAFGGSSCFNLTSFPNGPANLDCDTHPIGPNPSVDISRFGARAVVTVPQYTVNCVSGSPSLLVNTASGTFVQPGDYFVAYGCGPSVTLAAAPTPVVTSGASIMSTVPDAAIVAYTGSGTAKYALVSKDANGGLTAPSPVVTITTSVPLGQNTATVSSAVSSGNIMTITLGSAGPPNGAMFRLSYLAQGAGQTGHKLDGYYNVCSGGGTTTISVCSMPFWSQITDNTAAQIIWFNANYIAWTNQANVWTQYVCGQRPGESALHFLGSAIPASGNGPPTTVFDDWGTTMTPSSPTGFPEGSDDICTGTGNADYFSAKVVSCSASPCNAGTTITASANASQTLASANMQGADSSPALVAANAANVNAGVALTIPCPPNTSSEFLFLTPAVFTSIRNWVDHCGAAGVFETIDVGNVAGTWSVPWIGRAPAMLNSTPATMFCSAYPCLNNTGIIRNMFFQGQASASGLSVIENTNQVSNGNETIMLDHNQFQGSGYTSIGLMAIGVFPFGYMTNTRHSFGPGNGPSSFDATWTPWLYLNGSSESYFRNSYGTGRGIFLRQTNVSSPSFFEMYQNYVQGSIMPMVAVYGFQGANTSITSTGMVSDTSPQPVFVMETNPASPIASLTVRSKDFTGLPTNLYSGWAATQIYDEGNYGGQSGQFYPGFIFPDSSNNFGRVALQTTNRTDDFNRGSLGSTWINLLQSMFISGNQIFGSSGAWNEAYNFSVLANTNLGNGNQQNNTTGQYCDVTVSSYGNGQGGCGVYMAFSQTGNGYICGGNGTGTVFITIPNHFQVTSGSYSGFGPGDRFYETAFTFPGTANTQLSCTVFPSSGAAPPVTITASDPSYINGYPGVATFNTGAALDNFSGGTASPITYNNAANSFQAPQHLLSGTVGNTAPIPGVLPTGYWSAGTLQSFGYVAAGGLNYQYDPFNRANGGAGANWTNQLSTTLQVTNNQVGCSAATACISFWNANAFGRAQYSELIITSFGTGSGGPGVLQSGVTPNHNGYFCVENTTGVFFQKYINGSLTQTGPFGSAGVVGDVMRTEDDNFGNITCKQNGIVVNTAVDSTLTSGSPGMNIGFNSSTGDNWTGGNLNPLVQPNVETNFLQNQHIVGGLTLGVTNPISGALPSGYLSVGAYTDFFQQPSSPPPNPPAGYCRGFFAFAGQMTFTNSAGTSCGPAGSGGGMVFPSTVGLTRWTGGAAWAPSVNDTTALTGQPLVATNGLSSGFASPGIQDGNGAAHVTTTPYSVLCDSPSTIRDRGTTIIFDSGASVVNLPDHTLSGCGNNDAFVLINNSGGNLTVNRGGADTLDIYGLVGASTIAATSFTFPYNNWAAINNGETTRWNVRLGGNVPLPNVTTSTGTTAIAANTCTTATTVTMTGLAITQTIVFTPNVDVSGIAGWGSTGGLVIDTWPSANTVNYRVCNPTGSSITPGSSITWNISAR